MARAAAYDDADIYVVISVGINADIYVVISVDLLVRVHVAAVAAAVASQFDMLLINWNRVRSGDDIGVLHLCPYFSDAMTALSSR
eukprot:CAMPEP_0170999356 /NCGR_PEP_ID=MMETSP0736-20130129/14053_1 /TAXON_ID=186038 /ORGANISM="Fragilariopsis kerguelensis, Strain L26-C5" /LENGTH=84 /DNA_ID=CAMNT_0011426515 /DNA_START=92 /DNA_END=345 /DNA_ORIENTATION=-